MVMDVRQLAPLSAKLEPARLGPNIPDDLSTLRRGSVAVIIRRSPENGEQEVLLIKRTLRPTDHWSGHIALPGGRQDPGENDYETAVRETMEEVGLDLQKAADYIGPLEPRLIRIKWGKVIALVLCPFIFSIKDEFYDVELIPQDTEVAVAFWHPLQKLYSPSYRSQETVPISRRLNLPFMILNDFMSWQVGDMMFDAVDVIPDLPESVMKPLPPTPWKMWGITWGIMQDLRRLLDPSFNIHDIVLPTFKALDLRLILSLYSAPSVLRKRRLYASNQADWTNKMLNGHFTYFPYTIVTGLLLRFGVVVAAAHWLWRKMA